jgi:NhaA family Na+:H+ antiporter
MALFFFVIGLEIKRELAVGELRDRRAAILPLCAALGGMLVPALIYVAFVGGGAGSNGWGVPIATDIAFALGVLALLGPRIPMQLKVLLLGIAVIDDIGAILVIAIFYSGGVDLGWVLLAVLGLVVVTLARRVHVTSTGVYVALGIAVWLCTRESGLHATIAGVALGLLTPAVPFQAGDAVSDAARRIADITSDDHDDPEEDELEWRTLARLSHEAISPLSRAEHALHPWTSYVVLPLFALANVGVVLEADAVSAALSSAAGLGIMFGLVLGKPLGILAGSFLAVRSGVAMLPDRIGWLHVTGMGCLAGIGFTVSLFVTTLAFDDGPLATPATIAVLFASIVAGALGATILRAATRTRR